MSLLRRRLILGTAAVVVTSAGLVGAFSAASADALTAFTTTTPCVSPSRTLPWTDTTTGPTVLPPTTIAPPTTVAPPTTPAPATTSPPGPTTPGTPPTTRSTPPIPPPCPGAVAGVVLDNGRPMAGVKVDADSDFPQDDRSAVTGADGQYRIANVPPGQYRIRLTFPGNLWQYHPSVRSYNEAAIIVVRAGLEVVVNENVAPHGAVRGTVTTATGAPAANTRVFLHPIDGEYYELYTDELGRYDFPVVWAGQVKLWFDYDGGQTQYSPGQRTEAAARAYPVTVGQTVTVNERLLPQGVVTGTYRLTNGTPPLPLRVEAYTLDGRLVHETLLYQDFRFKLFPGRYVIGVRWLTTDRVDYWRQSATFAGATPIRVTATGTVTLNMVGVPDGTVTGTLTTAAGDPAGGASVQLTNSRTGWSHAVLADVTGSFRFDHVLPGTYTIRYNHIHQSQVGANPIRVRAGATTTVAERLLPPGTLEVTAYNRESGEPLASFCGEATGEGSSLFRCALGDSGVAVFDGLGAGRYEVVLQVGSPYPTATATVRSGQTTRISVPVG